MGTPCLPAEHLLTQTLNKAWFSVEIGITEHQTNLLGRHDAGVLRQYLKHKF